MIASRLPPGICSPTPHGLWPAVAAVHGSTNSNTNIGFATYKIVEAMHLLIQDNLKIQEKLYDSIINMSKNNRNNQSVLEHHDADNAMVKKFNEVEEVVHSIKQIMEKLHMLHESNSKKQEKILLLHAESNSNYKTNHFEKIVNLENKFDTLNVDTRNNNVKFHNRFND